MIGQKAASKVLIVGPRSARFRPKFSLVRQKSFTYYPPSNERRTERRWIRKTETDLWPSPHGAA
ncbi:hypothetical protein VARIO8X_20111 [Burkholderiales bacterium 8X]|nr:hypothetical protein VARIO8X_20111 [Burkholderiales bacterium 8X]